MPGLQEKIKNNNLNGDQNPQKDESEISQVKKEFSLLLIEFEYKKKQGT